MKIKYVISVFCLISLTIILIAIFMFSNIFSKDKSTAENAISSDKTVIRLVCSWGDSDIKAPCLEEILEDFQKDNPDILVLNESMSGEEFLFTLKTDFAEGNDPDVFGLWPGSDIVHLINANKVADLTDILMKDKKWYESFGKNAWSYDMHNGKIYGLPCEIIYEGLFVNKDLFDKFHVKVPQNYEELKKAVKAFRKNGIIPIAYNSSAEGTYIYQNIVMKLAGKKGTENPFYSGKLDKSFIDGLNYMKELYDMGAFPDNAFTIDNKTRDSLFVNKKAAMIVQGTWFIGNDGVKPDDDTVEIMPWPAFKEDKADSTAIIYGIGNGNFHISTSAMGNTQKKDASIRLLKALTSKKSAEILSNKTGYISNINIPENITNKGIISHRGRELIKNSKELIGPTDSFVDRTVWEDVLVRKFPMVLERKISAEDLYNEVQRKITEKGKP